MYENQARLGQAISLSLSLFLWLLLWASLQAGGDWSSSSSSSSSPVQWRTKIRNFLELAFFHQNLSSHGEVIPVKLVDWGGGRILNQRQTEKFGLATMQLHPVCVSLSGQSGRRRRVSEELFEQELPSVALKGSGFAFDSYFRTFFSIWADWASEFKEVGRLRHLFSLAWMKI